MNRKPVKIQIIPPFEQMSNNWELVTEIESALSQFLTHPQTFSPANKDDIERLGKSGIQQLVIIAKQFLHFVEILRNQQKNIEAIKASAVIAHQRLEQHEQIVRNYEKKFSERTKSMVQQNRVLKETNDKMKRSFMETEEALKSSLEESKSEVVSLRQELNKLEEDKKQLLEVITKLQEKLTNKEELISRLERVNDENYVVRTVHQRVEELLRFRIEKRKKPLAVVKEPQFPNSPPIEQLALKDISALAKVITFLTPRQVLQLSQTGKRMRLLCGTRLCIRSLCKSIIAVKNRRINYFKKHIGYFQKLREKVPVEILKNAYFRYHILKESAGHEIKQALNASSLIFEGRFEGQQLYSNLPDFNKEIPQKLNFEEANILEVDCSIIQKFKDARGQERDLLIKQFQQMYHKIKNTYDLYRADEESSSLFIANTLKHFSKVFVLAKSLYFQAEQLQNLNAFLLSELNTWDRMEIDKNLQLQDLKAQLQAQKKLKLFFTDKSIKSEQKALLQQNLKLTYQMKYNRLNDLMNLTCSQKDELSKKHVVLTKSNEKLTGENRELRKLYELTREKYNHVIEELVVVKETIIKMNII